MSKSKTINVRMSNEMHDQIGRITDRLNQLAASDPTRTKLSRTEVMRMVLEVGIDVMERKLDEQD